MDQLILKCPYLMLYIIHSWQNFVGSLWWEWPIVFYYLSWCNSSLCCVIATSMLAAAPGRAAAFGVVWYCDDVESCLLCYCLCVKGYCQYCLFVALSHVWLPLCPCATMLTWAVVVTTSERSWWLLWTDEVLYFYWIMLRYIEFALDTVGACGMCPLLMLGFGWGIIIECYKRKVNCPFQINRKLFEKCMK